ncbi:hypothetical protein ACSBR2_024930 [Camellia fascicularis]
MESYGETRMESYSYKPRDAEDTRNYLFEIKMAELQKTKDELKRAKDEAMQSWLDSRPLIDELEKLQSSLDATKNRNTMSAIVVSDLEAQLETTTASIRSKKDDELRIRATINKINQALDQTREEMEQLKLEKDEEKRARSELKQVLRLRKQTFRALQLTLRAIRLESEAFGSSAADALHYIKHSETDSTMVQLTQEDYCALTRRAKEETSLAEWRLSVSTEQRNVAEASRDSALRRLKELQTDNRLSKRKMKNKIEGDTTRDAEEEQDSRRRVVDQVDNTETAFPKARAKLMADSSQGNPQQQLRKPRNKNRIFKKKKQSIFVRISNFLVRKITRLFG